MGGPRSSTSAALASSFRAQRCESCRRSKNSPAVSSGKTHTHTHTHTHISTHMSVCARRRASWQRADGEKGNKETGVRGEGVGR